MWVEMYDSGMAALMFLTGYGIKAKTHAYAEIARFPTVPVASRVPVSEDARCWEMRDFCMGMGLVIFQDVKPSHITYLLYNILHRSQNIQLFCHTCQGSFLVLNCHSRR